MCISALASQKKMLEAPILPKRETEMDSITIRVDAKSSRGVVLSIKGAIGDSWEIERYLRVLGFTLLVEIM